MGGRGAVSGLKSRSSMENRFIGKTFTEISHDREFVNYLVDKYDGDIDAIKKAWYDTNFKNSNSDIRELSQEEIDKAFDESGVRDSAINGWFTQYNSGYKPEIENAILLNKDVKNASLNNAYKKYNEYLGMEEIRTGKKIEKPSFNKFINSEIEVYRGEHGQSHVSSDVFLSYSYDKNVAKSFGKNVTTLKIKPKDTYGVFGQYGGGGEYEILVPNHEKVVERG